MELNRRLNDWNERMLGLPRKAALVLLTLLLFVLALRGLPYVWPFAAAFVFSRILEPFVRAASKGLLRLRLSAPRSRAVATAAGMLVLFGLVGAVAAALVGWLLQELSGFLRSLPQLFAWLSNQAVPALMNLYGRWRALLPDDLPRLMEDAVGTLGQQAIGWAGSLSAWLTSGAWSTAASIPHALLSMIVTLMGTYYLTADRARIAAFFQRTFPLALLSRSRLIRTSLFSALLGQIRSQLTVSMIVMFFLMLTLGLSGVRYGAIIGLLIGIADALPVLGAGLFLLPWSLISFLTGAAGMGITLACLYAGTIVIRQILEPRIVGRHLGLYPLATMAAMYAGYRAIGFLGLLGGPLLLTAAKAVLEADEAATQAPLSPRR